ncbi:MAG: flagellar basal body L-ring protein FlgH [Alphaproteobacteria bacterium]|nr:flagellar basal body L-ring protein FlgH [Alphaproteobacteria bacterium]
MTRSPRPILRAAVLGLALSTLGACNTLTRLSEVGDAPKLSGIQNPNQQPAYKPVSMPMPTPHHPTPQANSLWRPGARAFFKDQRAAVIGDILTVMVDIGDEAKLDNKTSRSRTSGESAGLPNFLGLESRLNTVLPNAVSTESLIDAASESTTEGDGSMQRNETVKTTIAAIITQVLPNGNLVIAGRQEVRVNHELRELTLSGVIRPEDISSSNTISSAKIAEARISYGGRGVLSDVQQPRYGQQVFDIVFPF